MADGVRGRAVLLYGRTTWPHAFCDIVVVTAASEGSGQTVASRVCDIFVISARVAERRQRVLAASVWRRLLVNIVE
jgi:hypothetical protein